MRPDGTAAEFGCDISIGRIAGLRSGTPGGRRVLALHGWLDNAASFVPLAGRLPQLELVMPDLPGHGRSAHLPHGVEYTAANAIAYVLEIADALGWTRFCLLGHSMGAGIASLAAAAAPARIEALVAIEALGGLAENAGNTASRLRQAIAQRRALAGKALRVFPDLAMPVRARMLANHLDEDCARLLVERGIRPVEGGLVWSSDPRLTLPTSIRMTEAQIDDLVAAIECPTQVIYADPPQTYFPEALRRHRASLLAHGELAVIPGGHHLHMETPEPVAAVIARFLAAHREPVRDLL